MTLPWSRVGIQRLSLKPPPLVGCDSAIKISCFFANLSTVGNLTTHMHPLITYEFIFYYRIFILDKAKKDEKFC